MVSFATLAQYSIAGDSEKEAFSRSARDHLASQRL